LNEITTLEQLDGVLDASSERPVFIYKHSTICPSSFSAQRRISDYIKQAKESGADVPNFYLVNVIESRPVSNAIADRLGVPHKSPQLLLVSGGRCLWNTSHYNITAENIDKALRERAA
jgi:bacillithiol system protein YtxJ